MHHPFAIEVFASSSAPGRAPELTKDPIYEPRQFPVIHFSPTVKLVHML